MELSKEIENGRVGWEGLFKNWGSKFDRFKGRVR